MVETIGYKMGVLYFVKKSDHSKSKVKDFSLSDGKADSKQTNS